MKPATLAVVCTINNSREHTLDFVNRYVEVPGCRLILFLDDPTHLSYFDGDHVDFLTVTQCTKDYWQQEIGHLPLDMPEKQHTNIRKGAELARNQDIEWCVSVDSDEIILNLQDLIANLEKLGENADLLRILPAELIHDRRTAFTSRPFDGHYFKYCLTRDQLDEIMKILPPPLSARLLAIKKFTRRLFFGHTNGKTVFRLSAPISTYKQHRQFSEERELNEIVLPNDYLLLHYDAMNYGTWLAKWKRRTSGRTRATAISEKRNRQTRTIANSLRFFEGLRSKRLFRKWYVFSADEIIELKKAGVVFEISNKTARCIP